MSNTCGTLFLLLDYRSNYGIIIFLPLPLNLKMRKCKCRFFNNLRPEHFIVNALKQTKPYNISIGLQVTT